MLKNTKKIEGFEEVEICYKVDERKPILTPKLSILGDLFSYKTYLKTGNSSGLDQLFKNYIGLRTKIPMF
ncbi:hypothetical protein BCV71DRAFT_175774 [Rhizopus microsporus]|uniref:Uncharacterized protein n=1 Tax=Rhizopus microsporus TaxID=58291 RepID=A0A1X0S8C2_RHIZD|nr:hypothetical protein BCV71DRAFT_175774 [Rhizopus microsporus]